MRVHLHDCQPLSECIRMSSPRADDYSRATKKQYADSGAMTNLAGNPDRSDLPKRAVDRCHRHSREQTSRMKSRVPAKIDDLSINSKREANPFKFDRSVNACIRERRIGREVNFFEPYSAMDGSDCKFPLVAPSIEFAVAPPAGPDGPRIKKENGRKCQCQYA